MLYIYTNYCQTFEAFVVEGDKFIALKQNSCSEHIASNCNNSFGFIPRKLSFVRLGGIVVPNPQVTFLINEQKTTLHGSHFHELLLALEFTINS